MRIFFLGTRKLGYLGLNAVLAAGHTVVGIVTKDYDINEGYTTEDFKRIARKHQIPIYFTDRINNREHADIFRSLNPDVGVSLYWKRLVNSDIIETARLGFINAHAGDLPKYRGFAAINYAILLGEEKLGICIHRMTPMEADTGDILARRYLPIDEKTIIGDLLEQFNTHFVEMTLEVLTGLENGTVTPIRQDPARLIMAYPRLPRDGRIDWGRSAIEIDRLIRSVSHPYPGAYTYFNDKKLFIWASRPVHDAPPYVGTPGHVVRLNADGSVWVTTGDGILSLIRVQLENGDEVQPRAVLNSVQIRFGPEIEDEIIRLKHRMAVLEAHLSTGSPHK